MDLEHAIFTRRTVHKYLPDAVAQDDLDKMMMAGHMAPCHKLTWPWRFIQVGPETREKIVPVAIACKTVNRECTPELEDSIRRKILGSGALIVVSQVRCDNDFRSKEDYAAVSCAIQNGCAVQRAVDAMDVILASLREHNSHACLTHAGIVSHGCGALATLLNHEVSAD